MALRALSTPNVAAMLTPADAWSLERTAHKISVQWNEIKIRLGCLRPKLLGIAQSTRARWTENRALRLLQSAQDTPFPNARVLVQHLLRHLLTPDQLWWVGRAAHNLTAMRLATRLQRRATRFV